ncbi:hypothetical protein LTR10_021831 [Elasticomyces elasticus]|uniref:Uncharacterized protein n=1 Tax=Exophiala sideris TaxID=1016849 RepID=A0ABR0JF65_9EURO|nr:hypothetical protein LTR10_021831 [Elasticomyces elasticus]KAK5025263.1 hypothetical protein LTS07_008114 [Exophiala sideris]KAK5029188.1 hypothetical protein LTR13_008725 [Exophiala sideris]KAK5063323.1 hypothetical protein LTR69_004029 [Exophiala sideris]KAK5179038.1 hypothetical protein LTR44_008527 [Eurotiomycetes sp. CCFEE 6388]
MEVDSDVHPNPVPNPHHRKIELQMPDDLTYLHVNLIASAQQKIDLHFPPSAIQDQSGAQPATVITLDGLQAPQSASDSLRKPDEKEEQPEDPLRVRVRQLVDAFITKTWNGASQNISVNGMDASSLPNLSRSASQPTPSDRAQEECEGVDFTYEPYDTRLQAKVARLYGELEALTAQVSKLRRTAPKHGADAYGDALMAELASADADHDAQMMALRENAGAMNNGVLTLKLQREGWRDDVKAVYEHGVSELAVLAGLAAEQDGSTPRGASLTETVGKVQRVRTVAMEFE